MSSSWWHGCPRRSVPERPDPDSAQRETQHAQPRWPARSRRLIRRKTRYTQGKRELQRAPARSAAEFLNLVAQVRILPGHAVNDLEKSTFFLRAQNPTRGQLSD